MKELKQFIKIQTRVRFMNEKLKNAKRLLQKHLQRSKRMLQNQKLNQTQKEIILNGISELKENIKELMEQHWIDKIESHEKQNKTFIEELKTNSIRRKLLVLPPIKKINESEDNYLTL